MYLLIFRRRTGILILLLAISSQLMASQKPGREFLAYDRPKHILWYDAEHQLNVEAARNDRREWLTEMGAGRWSRRSRRQSCNRDALLWI